MTRHDIWKTASPWEEGEDCCDDCSENEECDSCFCHATKEDIAAMKGEDAEK